MSGSIRLDRREPQRREELAEDRAAQSSSESFLSACWSKVTGAFSHSSPKSLDHLIEIFNKISTSNKPILLGNEQRAKGIKECSLDAEDITLYDLKKIVKELKISSSSLFNLRELGEHEAPFNALLAALDTEITLAQDAQKTKLTTDKSQDIFIDKSTGKVMVKLAEASKNSLNHVSSKIRQLKHERAGYLTSDYWIKEASPLLEEMINLIQKTHETLKKHPGSPRQFLAKYQDLKKCLKQALIQREIVFKGFKTKDSFVENIHDVLDLFEKFELLPEALRTDQRFSPTIRDLHESLDNLAAGIGKHEKLSSKAKKRLEKLYLSLKNLIPIQLQEDPESKKHHSLEILHAALSYFDQDNYVEPEQGKEALIKELIKDCSKSLDGFEKAFNKCLGKKASYSQMAPLQTALTKTLKDLIKKKDAAITLHADDTFETLAAHLLGSDTPLESTVASLTSNGTALSSFAEFALNLLSKAGSGVKAASISFIGSGFLYVLKHPTLQQWLNHQSPDTQRTLSAFFKQTEDSLYQAIKSKKASELISFFKQFLKDYNSYQFSIDGFELPTILKESAVPSTEGAQPSAQERLIAMMKPLSQLEHQVADEKDYSEETDNQAKLLSENCGHFLTFNLIYEKLLRNQEVKGDDQLFFDIITRIKQAPKGENPNDLFIAEMRLLIDRSTEISRPTKWLLKYLVPLLHKWSIYHISRFTNKFLHYIRDELANIQREPDGLKDAMNSSVAADESVEKRKRIMHRFNNGITTYEKMLKKWVSTGKDKTIAIEELSRKKEFNEGFTELELMRSVGNTAIDRFLEGIDTTEPIRDLGTKFKNFLGRPLLSSHDIVSKSISFFFSGLKVIFIGAPVGLVLGASYIVAHILKMVLNTALRSSLKLILSKNNVLNMLVDRTKASIYEQNPYVNIITETLADQLESLSKALDGVNEGSEETSSDEKVLIPEQTRLGLQGIFENFLELLNKNRFLTSDKLESYLTHKGTIDQTLETIDDLTMPGVIDALIEASVVAAKSILDKNLLEKQFCLLFAKTNDILTTNPKLTSEEKKKLNQKYANDENRVKMYLDKILKQIIDQAVKLKLDNFGRRQFLEIENIRKWIQDTLINSKDEHNNSLLEQWQERLQALYDSSSTVKPEDILSELKTVRKEISSFLHELSNKISAIKDTTSSESKEKFTKEINPLLDALKAFVDDKYFISLYRNTEQLAVISNNLPIIDRIQITHEIIHEQLEIISSLDPAQHEDQINSAILSIDRNIALGEEGLKMIKDKKIHGNHSDADADKIKNIVTDLNSREYKTFKEAQLSTQKLTRDLKALASLNDLLDTLDREKTTSLKTTLSHRILSGLHLREDTGYKEALKAIKAAINTIQDDADRQLLRQLIDEYHHLVDEHELQGKLHAIRETIDNALKTQHESLTLTIEKSKAFSHHLSTQAKELVDSWSQTRNDLIQANKALVQEDDDNLLKQLSSITAAARELKPVNIVHMETGFVDYFSYAGQKGVYHRIRPKIEEAINLLKDGAFASHMVKHALLIPFVEKDEATDSED